jgi:WD repeat-containing protein 19
VIPQLYSAYDNYVALLSSLTEVSVVDTNQNNMVIAKTDLDLEPGFVNLGQQHFAVGINSSIWYYRWRADAFGSTETKVSLVCKRDYFGTIKAVQMNDAWTAVLSDGQVTLHQIESQDGEDFKLPPQSDKPIVSMYIVDSFLIMLDAGGKLMYYLIEDQALLSEHTEENKIVKIFPNKKGTRIVCIDSTGQGIFYNPVNDSTLMIPNFSPDTINVLFDNEDRNMFVTIDKEKINTYLFCPISLEGPCIFHLPEYLKLDEVEKSKAGVITYIDRDLSPIILKGGFVYSYARSDGIRGQYLTTHSYINSWRAQNDSDEGHLRYFLQNLAAHRYADCLEVARTCRKFGTQFYEIIGRHALKNVELEVAETAFQMCKNVGMVYSIQSIINETDKQILVGHIASILFKYDVA